MSAPVSALPRARGPVMLGVEGLALSAADCERLCHPAVGGVILFARNYAHAMQLRALTAAIRAVRSPALLIGVDHEGGRVQRFREGFSTIPPMRTLGERFDVDRPAALRDAHAIGRTIAGELVAHGVDFSFTPVLDLDHGASAIIGDRAFHREAATVMELGRALVDGLHAGGSAAVGKHFPGHGFVAADSHVDLPVDPRPLARLLAEDIEPFARLAPVLDAVMPAHVVYPDVDAQPAGFSRIWVQGILRERLRFDGLVFSDDLEMTGAHGAGDIVARAQAAATAGCDVVLACNDFAAMDVLLERWTPPPNEALERRMRRMQGRPDAAA